MSQGVMILIAMAAFFGGMVIFSAKFSNLKEKREIKRRIRKQKEDELKEQQYREETEARRALIDEKYQLAKERRKAIKQEMKELKQFNQELENKFL